jgi:hypothetical protein
MYCSFALIVPQVGSSLVEDDKLDLAKKLEEMAKKKGE